MAAGLGDAGRRNDTALADRPIRPGTAGIAVVGMATLLPASDSLARFWRLILSGESAIREIPPDRWSLESYHDPDRGARDKVYARHGGFLDDVPFDPLAYGIQPAAIPFIEPMQLLALRLVHEAVNDALRGATEDPDRERTSVILGFSGGMGELGTRYVARAALPELIGHPTEDILALLPEWSHESFPGILPNVIAGRVANRLDFGGTNLTIDADCASSLAAVYLGMMELESGRADRVVAGGVDATQSSFGYMCHAKSLALSPRGTCKIFDATSDGIVISEGMAAVVLRRIADAERDGDRIYAVIKGAGASSDGRAEDASASQHAGQRRALDRAYAQAGFAPAGVDLFEAHGSGTVAGDQVELETLNGALAATGAAPATAAVGSVKTLIGHTKAAAGIAGLIKVALGLHHRVLPPHAFVERPNPAFDASASPLYLAQSPRPWVRAPDRPRRAGVSAFGVGGTNFHVVLEDHVDRHAPAAPAETGGDLVPLVFAADNRAGLIAVLDQAGPRAAPSLPSFAHTLASKVATGGERLGFSATCADEAADRIAAARAYLDSGGDVAPEGIHHRPSPVLADGARIALLLPGEEAAYPGMLRRTALLLPALARSLEAAESSLAGAGEPAEPRLSRLVWPGDAFDPGARRRQGQALARPDAARAAVAALQSGLVAALRELGLAPAAVAGRGWGRTVARHAAGEISFDALMRLCKDPEAETGAREASALPVFDLGTGLRLDDNGGGASDTDDGVLDPAAILGGLASAGIGLLLDLGPGSAVSDRLRRLAGAEGPRIVALDRDGGDALAVMDRLIQLWVEGAELDLARLVAGMAEVKPRPRPADTRGIWLLNGAYARAADEPPRVVASARGAAHAMAGDPVAPALLLRGARRRPGEPGALDWRLDLKAAPYLDDHRFDGRPVLPMASFLQAAGEVPAILGLSGQVVAIEDVRIFRGLTLDRPGLDLRFTLDEPDAQGRYRVTLADTAAPLPPRYRCDLRLSPELAAVPPGRARLTRGTPWRGKPPTEIYRDWLSHGPRFQTLTHVDQIGPDAVLVKMRPTDPADFVPVPSGQRWSFDPGLIDGLLQLLWIWARVMQNTSALPVSAAAVRRYAGDPSAGPIAAEVDILTAVDDPAVVCDIRAYDALGALIYEVESFRGQASPRLNRLGGGWRRSAEPAPA